MYEPDFDLMYFEFLNGCHPVTDWDDIKSWAEKLLKVEDTKK